MKKNVTLTIILAVLVSLFLLMRNQEEKRVEKDIATQNIKLFEQFDKSKVSTILIKHRKNGETLTFEKDGTGWKIKELNYPAEKNSVNGMLEALSTMRLGRKIGTADEAAPEMGFAGGIEVTVGDKKFTIGERRRAEMYLLFNNEIYISPSSLRHRFEKYDGEWRDRSLFSGKKPEELKAVILSTTVRSETFQEKEGKVPDIFSSLTSLRVSTF